ncbi:MAG: aminotransferase class IV [Planctomycetota bacterium]|nr:aminotransferase class IV [Planctomycetota bacterium]
MVAWVDGRFVPPAEAVIPVGDAGFVFGATVTEQLRSFGGRLFLPAGHAARFRRSLEIVGIEPAWPVAHLFEVAAEVTARCHAAGPVEGDLGVVVFATPGDAPAQHGGRPGTSRVLIHAFPLAFASWAGAYETGVVLRSVSTTQIPPSCWPIELKCRSRMHYHLADREARAAEPGARALLLHADGRVSETSTANVVVVVNGALRTPPAGDALAGISLAHLHTLAHGLGIGWQERSLSLADLAAADEILLTSTPNCLLPVTRLDGQAVGDGRPGPLFAQLLAAWGGDVGIDIATQARRCAGILPGGRGA